MRNSVGLVSEPGVSTDIEVAMRNDRVRRCSPELQHRARELRHTATPAEKVLWEALRSNQLGVHFRRQHPVGIFILDFYCPAHQLVIEVDGGIHDAPEGQQRDHKRTAWIRLHGCRVLRFRNEVVLTDLPHVLAAIRATWEP